MTPEEAKALDAWREDEAWRIVGYPDGTKRAAQHEEYRRLVRDDVRPPVVVDRLLIEAREICAKFSNSSYDECGSVELVISILKRGVELGKLEGARLMRDAVLVAATGFISPAAPADDYSEAYIHGAADYRHDISLLDPATVIKGTSDA